MPSFWKKCSTSTTSYSYEIQSPYPGPNFVLEMFYILHTSTLLNQETNKSICGVHAFHFC